MNIDVELLKQYTKHLPNHLQEQIEGKEVEFVTAVAAILAIALLSFALSFFVKSPVPTVVMVGLCGAGKTTLFYQLRDGSVHNGTVASMQENVATITPRKNKGRPVRVVDLPGHPRLRGLLEGQAQSGVSAVVLLLDAADFLAQAKDVAELLYDTLTLPAVARCRPPLLVACNKADLGDKAFSPAFIKKQLQNQITTVRQSRMTGQLAGEQGRQAALGDPKVSFTFESLRQKVTLVSISAKEG